MTKYIKQKDNSSCVPVAVINIMKWAGLKAGIKDIKRIRKLCKTKNGTSLYNLKKVLKKTPNIRSYFFYETNIKKIDKIKDNELFIFYVFFKNLDAHCFILEKKLSKKYKVLNYDGKYGKAIKYINRNSLIKIMKNKSLKFRCCGFKIVREKNDKFY